MESHSANSATSLPAPDVYEQEYVYWPWGELLKWVSAWVERHAPKHGLIVDYMCGTGYLLNDIVSRRPDLTVYGCSITPAYVEWANQRYSNITIVCEDAFAFTPPGCADVILCTAGLHHLAFERQEAFLSKAASELQPGGWFVIGEEVIGVDDVGPERQKAVLDLWHQLMKHAVQSEAPESVLGAAIEVMRADLFWDGEFKRSQPSIKAMLDRQFTIADFAKTWPDTDVGYGDCVWVCRTKACAKGASR
jgi:SAM-dependent methyltransferase